MNDLQHNCELWAEPISLLAAGFLAGDEEREVRRHVETCPDCRERFGQLTQLCGALAEAQSPVNVAEDAIVERVMSTVASDDLRRPIDQREAEMIQPRQLSRSLDNWRRIMRSPAFRISTAAVFILAVTFVALLFHGGGTTCAFADVAEALNNVHSATWKTTTVTKLKLPGESEERTVTTNASCIFLAPSHERTESTVDGQTVSIQIVNGTKGKVITLIPATKTAMVINLKDFPPENNPLGRNFQGLRELVANAQSGSGEKVERLGAKTIDGHAAEGFHFQVGPIDVKIWADAKTLLPIRVEQGTTKAAEGPKVNLVMTDFKVNVPLEESLFAADLPPGYTVQQTTQIDASNPWKFLTGVLKLAAEFNDGVFPPTLRGEQGIVAVIQQGTRTLAEKHKESPDELRKLNTDVTVNVAGFRAFLYATPADALHYAGKDVKLGTADRPILWVERRRDGRCMVIYADLSIKEVSAKEMPRLPDSDESPKPE